jgi:hypothetical protein
MIDTWEALATLIFLLIFGILVRHYVRRRPNAEEVERRRRDRIAGAGKLADGEVFDVRDTLILYEYGVAGVVYTASQDVSSLGPFLPADPMSIIGPATIKFDRRNPANSMVVCERWNGLGSRSPIPTDVVSQANSR